MRKIVVSIFLFCYINILFGQGVIDITNQCKFPDHHSFSIPSFELYDELIFKNEESFKNFYGGNKLHNIDFSKYILLSKWYSGGGCNTDYKYQITLDSNKKEIFYTVYVNYEGTCEVLSFNSNFVLVPVPTDDYSITCRLIVKEIITTSGNKSPIVDSLKQSSSVIIEKIKALQDSLSQISNEIKSLDYNDYWLRQKELELYGIQTYTINGITELYKEHDFRSEILASISPRSKVRVFDKYGYYLKIKYNGKSGWIKSGQIVLHEDIYRLDDKRFN